MWEKVKVEVNENGVALFTLNSPENMNSFTIQLCQDIVDASHYVRENDAVKVVVITGEGYGFSGGGDVGTLAGMTSPAKAKWTYDVSFSTVQSIYEIEKPVIAAINGPVAGAAVALMMACDIIIASEKSKFGYNFINLAFCPDSGASYFLTRKLGYHKALDILWNGKVLTPDEAYNLGIINKVVAPDQLINEAMTTATRLAAGPLMTIGLDKKLVREAMTNDFYQQAELEAMYQVLTWASDDFKEGCHAFVEKRKPHFSGK
ncbi:MAG: enoyl-CoA hydratase/isomerase family protein [Methylocystaceae bacterium]